MGDERTTKSLSERYFSASVVLHLWWSLPNAVGS
jgi:hypothetical protein